MNFRFLPESKADAYAIQALAKGEATPEQGKRALECIVKELAGTYEQTFDPESQRASDFNEGRRHVGRAIVGIINGNLTVMYAALEKKPAPQSLQPPVHRKRK